LILSLSIPLSFAGKATDLPPSLAKPGKVVVEDDFSAAQLAKTWW